VLKKIDKHEYFYDKIVIGGGLNALLFSYYNNIPCIFVRPEAPFRFDMFHDKVDLSSLGADSACSKLELWQRLIFILSLSGLLPMSSKADSISIKENKMKVITENSRLGRFEFRNIIIFDDHKIKGLPPIRKQEIGKCRVVDWFDVRTGMEHDHDILQTKDSFIKEVIFYPSERFGNQKTERIRKDLVAISYLDENQLNNFDYSDTMAKFKIIQMMKDAGIKGARNGRDLKNPNLYRYYSPKIESVERQIYKNIKNLYKKDKRFSFLCQTPEQVIEKFSRNELAYSTKITDLLFKKD